jgi:2-polyprenyl-3-methyl-5-hydroxy-6-metoxy-1,4-benzoquinol methylase
VNHTATSPCTACGHFVAVPDVGFRRDGEEAHVVLRCRDCGHRFLDGWDRLYDVASYDYYANRLNLTREQLHDPLTTERLRSALATLRQRTRGPRLLDVGCGEGQLVHAALELGLDARGIDVSEPAVQICQGFGLPCEVLDLFSPSLDGERFDLVTLVETIEHVPEPRRFLARTGELLDQGGAVWLTTPNVASLGRRVLGERWPAFAPEHLSYFSPRSLRGLAEAAGFRSVRIRSRTLSAAAVRAILRRPMPPAADGAPGAVISDHFAAEQRLRHQLEDRPVLRLAKGLVNLGLSAAGLGETLVAELRR